ncbi:MAG TPA: penicillin-binding transpeptidase domain-containing protein, partial [Bacillota bacterium]
TALAGLEHGLGDQTVYCPGVFVHAGRTYEDWQGHGHVDLTKGIGRSCNVYFWTMGLRLGTERMGEMAQKLGLDGTSGLRDLSGEKPGEFPFGADPLNTAIGQGGHLYTPLQIAVFFATVANGGTRYRPYLVDQILTPAGEVVYQASPEVLAELDVPQSTLDRVVDGMVGVTSCIEGWCGTAYGTFAGAPYVVAGKTGTVERGGLGSEWNHAWFASFAPAGAGQQPEIAVVVLIEGGGGGSRAAAPVARRIYDVYFGLAPSPLDPPPVEPEPPVGTPTPTVREDSPVDSGNILAHLAPR